MLNDKGSWENGFLPDAQEEEKMDLHTVGKFTEVEWCLAPL